MTVEAKLSQVALFQLSKMSSEDRDDFGETLQRVCVKPLARSQAVLGVQGRRFFEFGSGTAKIAIFEHDALWKRIRIIKCRRFEPEKPRPVRRDRRRRG